MDWLIPITCFVAGLISGIAIMRYVAGFTTNLIYQIKEDLPILNEPNVPMDQCNTDGTTDQDLEKEDEELDVQV